MNAPLLLLAAAAAVIAASLAYVRLLRPWQLRWGATSDEITRTLPGDELVAEPTFNATRAITIAARPDHIWPWLLQVGVTRAGWYSYDLLDNLARPSAREVITELQQVAVGDVVPLSPDGKQGVHILALDLPRSMLWGTLPNTTWLWACEPRADGTTRLVTRIRSHYRWLSPSIAFSMLVEFADIWMIRKMLLNLRERAEGLARAESSATTPLHPETVA
jgi:hypothetical protein